MTRIRFNDSDEITYEKFARLQWFCRRDDDARTGTGPSTPFLYPIEWHKTGIRDVTEYDTRSKETTKTFCILRTVQYLRATTKNPYGGGGRKSI
jgi:hypothetical protein